MELLLFYNAGRAVRLYGFLLAGILLASCAEPIVAPAYRVTFPEPPTAWTDALGPPSWELFWVDGRGYLQSARCQEGAEPRIELEQERAVPLLARPFWPAVVSAGGQADEGIQSGVMKSAGAVFPFDAADGLIRLSWEGGICAEFYLALARARLASKKGAGNGALSADKRRPEWFDWPRFVSLLESDDIPEEVRKDPWLVDWSAAAAKTIESGWNSKRIKAAEYTPLAVEIPADGLWFGTSPFAPARFRKTGETVELPAREIPEYLLSSAGYLKYTKSDCLWHEWQQQE
jgi:hypothetical protein